MLRRVGWSETHVTVVVSGQVPEMVEYVPWAVKSCVWPMRRLHVLAGATVMPDRTGVAETSTGRMFEVTEPIDAVMFAAPPATVRATPLALTVTFAVLPLAQVAVVVTGPEVPSE
jgi:hypothetical protein